MSDSLIPSLLGKLERRTSNNGTVTLSAGEGDAVLALYKAARAVVGARKEVFQIAAPETMWRKLAALQAAVKG